MYIKGRDGRHWKKGIYKLDLTPFILKDIEEIKKRHLSGEILEDLILNKITLRKIGYENCIIEDIVHKRDNGSLDTDLDFIEINDSRTAITIYYIRIRSRFEVCGDIDEALKPFVEKIQNLDIQCVIKDKAYKKLKFDEKDREKFHYLTYDEYCNDRAHLIYNYVNRRNYDVSIKGIYKTDIKAKYDQLVNDYNDADKYMEINKLLVC